MHQFMKVSVDSGDGLMSVNYYQRIEFGSVDGG